MLRVNLHFDVVNFIEQETGHFPSIHLSRNTLTRIHFQSEQNFYNARK